MRKSVAHHVRVYLYREVAVDVGDRMAKRSIILGEGTLRLLPGSEATCTGDLTLNWEGEVRCRDPASVAGSFDCGSVVVRVRVLLSRSTFLLTVIPGCAGRGDFTAARLPSSACIFWVFNQVDDG